MCKNQYILLLIFSYFIGNTVCAAQRLSLKEQKIFQQKCEILAKTFCGYIEELTEENSNSEGMSVSEFYNSKPCQWNIRQMRHFFSKEHLLSGKIIGYTQRSTEGKPIVRYTSIERYITMLLQQRKKYRTVRYDFAAFMVTELEEKKDASGNIYYEGEVKFKQNYYASRSGNGNPELGDWDVFHQDYKKLTFTIQRISTKDGKFFIINFHKLKIDLEAYT